MDRRSGKGDPVLLRDVSLSDSPHFRRLAVVAAWRRVIGPTLADRSRVGLDGDRLDVFVPDERWARAVERMAPGLLARIREQPGVKGVSAIAVRVDPELSGVRPASRSSPVDPRAVESRLGRRPTPR
jgi:hypothetical protein